MTIITNTLRAGESAEQTAMRGARREIAPHHTIPPHAMRLVLLESPFAGDIEANTGYARACIRDCLLRGEAPIASHLLYTQPGILDDADRNERAHGINAGHAWMRAAEAVVVYTDRGVSMGMLTGINSAKFHGKRIEYRILPGGTAPNVSCETKPEHPETV